MQCSFVIGSSLWLKFYWICTYSRDVCYLFSVTSILSLVSVIRFSWSIQDGTSQVDFVWLFLHKVFFGGENGSLVAYICIHWQWHIHGRLSVITEVLNSMAEQKVVVNTVRGSRVLYKAAHITDLFSYYVMQLKVVVFAVICFVCITDDCLQSDVSYVNVWECILTCVISQCANVSKDITVTFLMLMCQTWPSRLHVDNGQCKMERTAAPLRHL